MDKTVDIFIKWLYIGAIVTIVLMAVNYISACKFIEIPMYAKIMSVNNYLGLNVVEISIRGRTSYILTYKDYIDGIHYKFNHISLTCHERF